VSSINKIIGKMLGYLIISITVILFIFPFYWMVVTSTQEGTGLYSAEDLIPREISMDNYIELINLKHFARWNFNSMFISSITVILTCLFCTMAGYIFAKKNIPGGNVMFWLLLITMTIPTQTLLVPLFMLMKQLKMFNTYQGLILPSLVRPFGIFLMKQVISTIPSEFLDAAKIDGADEFQIFRNVIIPLAKSGIIVLAIFTFISSYNDYFWQLLMISTEEMKTVPLAVACLQEDEFCTNINFLMAGAVMASVPMLLVYVFLQKYFIQGITIGGIKG